MTLAKKRLAAVLLVLVIGSRAAATDPLERGDRQPALCPSGITLTASLVAPYAGKRRIHRPTAGCSASGRRRLASTSVDP
jgi:hypothetical protein